MLDRTLKIEDISSEYTQMAELLGIDRFLALVDEYGGCQIYIPKAEGLCRNARDEEIRASFTGFNITELAKKYNLSTRQIRTIIAPVFRQVRNKPIDGQVGLFDLLPSNRSGDNMKNNIENSPAASGE